MPRKPTPLFNALACFALVHLTGFARSETYFVVPASTPNHTAVYPYTSWETAATNIADAVAVTEEDKTVMDTVYLTNGIHYITTPVSTEDNRITIKSWDGNPETTIINGNYPANQTRAFHVLAKHRGPAYIEGLAFTNCHSTATGGAIYFRGASNGAISNCWFLGNVAAERGGAINLERAGFIKNCRFVGNASNEGGAVGVTADVQTSMPLSGQPAVIDCVFSNNMSCKNGGAAISGAHGYLVSRCTFVDNVVSNTVTAYGGAIALGHGGTVHASLITGTKKLNTGYVRGVAVASPNNRNNSLLDCRIEKNAGGESAVHFLDGLSTIVENCTILDNTNNVAAVAGSMVMRNTLVARNANVGFLSGNPVSDSWGSILENCTITANGTFGYQLMGNTLTNQLVNCIVQGNAPGDQWKRPQVSPGPAFLVENSCLSPLPSGGDVVVNDAVITTDPAFKNPAAGDYRLRGTSPCRNSGANALPWLADARDLGGSNPRILEDVVDMGCYEYFNEHPCTVVTIR
ncbi:MAG: right-handed parallel beta-helix repeat-containing protein [Kiritimatiellia bacterium]